MTGDQARDRPVEIAVAWQAAIVGIAYIPLAVNDLRKRLERLAADAADALADGRSSVGVTQTGRAIGRELVGLNIRKPQALEKTLACLSVEFGAHEPMRLGQLLAGIAGGFAEAAEVDLLQQQEKLSRSATSALRQAQSELQTSRDELAKSNRDLFAQINERIRAEQTQREYAERLRRLHEIDLAMLSAESLSAIVDISINHIQHIIPALSISIALIEPANNRLVILKSTNPIYPAGRMLPITMLDALRHLDQGQDFYIPDIGEMRGVSPGVDELVERGGRSLLTVPLRYQEELIGGLIIVLNEVRRLSGEEIAVSHEIADSVTVAIQNRRLLEAEREAYRRELTLREVSAHLTLGLTPAELSRRILGMLERVLSFRSAAIILLEDDALKMTARHGDPILPEQTEFMMAQRPNSIMSVIRTRRPVIINDTGASPDWVPLAGFEFIRAWMGVPLLVKGECIGILAIDRDELDAFSESDSDLAFAFANQAAIAIENGRLFAGQQAAAAELARRYRERGRELDVLYDFTVTAVSKVDLESLLERSLELAVDSFGCTAAAVFLAEGDDSELKLSAIIDRQPSIAGAMQEFLHGNPVLWPRPVNALYIWTEADLPAGWPRETDSTLAVLPLRSSGSDLGLFCLVCDSAGRLTDEDMPLLVTVVDQIAAAIENIRLRQVARQAAIIEERERLAQEIHDSVTQSIYSVALFAGAAQGAIEANDTAKAQERIRLILNVTDLSLRELRLLLFELRTESLARLGLVEGLRERLRIVEHRAGVQGEVHVGSISDLPIAIEEAFYRVALEALNNSLRHAQARQVAISLMEEDGYLSMTIADDGAGFDETTIAGGGGMGLGSMQKRADKVGGVLTLTSRVGEGTKVLVRAPLR